MPENDRPTQRVTVKFALSILDKPTGYLVASVWGNRVGYEYEQMDEENGARGISWRISPSVEKKLHEMGAIESDEERNRKENPYEDYHDIWYRRKR